MSDTEKFLVNASALVVQISSHLASIPTVHDKQKSAPASNSS